MYACVSACARVSQSEVHADPRNHILWQLAKLFSAQEHNVRCSWCSKTSTLRLHTHKHAACGGWQKRSFVMALRLHHKVCLIFSQGMILSRQQQDADSLPLAAAVVFAAHFATVSPELWQFFSLQPMRCLLSPPACQTWWTNVSESKGNVNSDTTVSLPVQGLFAPRWHGFTLPSVSHTLQVPPLSVGNLEPDGARCESGLMEGRLMKIPRHLKLRFWHLF